MKRTNRIFSVGSRAILSLGHMMGGSRNSVESGTTSVPNRDSIQSLVHRESNSIGNKSASTATLSSSRSLPSCETRASMQNSWKGLRSNLTWYQKQKLLCPRKWTKSLWTRTCWRTKETTKGAHWYLFTNLRQSTPTRWTMCSKNE